MALDFPNSPSVNQVYSSGGYSWEWDGSSWNSLGVTDIGNAGSTRDEFIGTGTNTTFTLTTTAVNESSTLIFIDSVLQSNASYTVNANSKQIVFSESPANNSKIIAYTIAAAGPQGPSGSAGPTGPAAGVDNVLFIPRDT